MRGRGFVAGLAVAKGPGDKQGGNKACDTIEKLERMIEIANNQTELDRITKSNTTGAEEFQAAASAAAATLSSLESNSTLTALCAVADERRACNALAKLAEEQALAANITALVSLFLPSMARQAITQTC